MVHIYPKEELLRTFVSNMKFKLRGSIVGKSTQFNNKDTEKIGPTNENFKSLLLELLKML